MGTYKSSRIRVRIELRDSRSSPQGERDYLSASLTCRDILGQELTVWKGGSLEQASTRAAGL